MREPEKEEASQQPQEDAPPASASGGVLPSAWVLCLGGATLFSLTTWLVVVFVPTNKEMEAVLDAQVPEEVWSWTMVAFLTALFMNIMTLIFQLGTIRGPTLILACYINTLAAVSHFLYWKKISPTVEDVWGHPFEIEREVMWLFATPMMVLNLSTISDFSVRKVQKVMIADVGMILFGLAFRLVPHKETSAFCFIGSMACFGYVLPNLWNMFNAPLNCSSQTATSARALRFIRMYTMVFWNTFWIVELLLWFDILPIGLSAYMLAGLDIGGKVVFSSSLVLGNMDTMDQRRRNAMQVVEEANKVQVINELKEVIEYKNHFLSSTSHELRTPLNGIIGLSEAILSGCCGEIPANVIKIITTVKSSGNRLLNLVNDILDSASMQKGKLVIKHEKVQLATLAEDVVDLCAPLVKKGVVLSSGITTHMPPVRGDHGRIIQILYNLVGNSCKFTHSGTIAISARQEGSMVFVSVSDSGVGIPASKFSSVFEKFEQVDIGTTRKYGGTGLGLSLVKDLVEAHDGQISVASEMGVGTSFTFTLPVFDEATHGHHHEEHHPKDDVPVEDNTHPVVLEREPSIQQCNRQLPPIRTELHPMLEVAQPTPVLRPNCNMSSVSTARKVPYKKTLNEATGELHVLSVDDDPVNQLVVKNLMSTRSEMKVTQAMNGEDALKACKDAEYLPDVILLDVMMPGMNGYEVCQTFRESYPDSGTVIIMLSAKTKEQNIVDGLRAGSNDYMTKPFGRQELLARIDAHLLYHDILRRGTAKAAKAVEFERKEDEVRGLEGTPFSATGRRTASPSMAQVSFNAYSTANSIITPSAILTRNDSFTLPIGLMPDLPNALKQVEDGPFQVDFDSVVIISVSVVNLDNVLETHSLADVLVGLSALHVHAQDLVHKFHAYMEVKPYGDGFNMYLGFDTVGKPRDVATAAMELASQLLEGAEDVHAKQHVVMELRIGGHIGGISGLVVDYSHPVMQCCGQAVHHALALKDTCPPGCVHLSKALVDHAKGSLAHCVPASEDTWLMRVGPWQEQLSKVQQEWNLHKIDTSHSVYNTQCLAAQPLQIALCWVAAAKSLQVWETATKVNSKGRRLKELEELRRVKLLLEAQLAEVSQDCDRLQDVVSSLTQRLDETNRCNVGLARSTLSSLETQAAAAYASLERELESSYVIREEHLQNMVKQAQDEMKSLAEMHAKKEQGLRAAMDQETEKLQAANVRLFELEADIAIIQTELKNSKQELDKYKTQLQESKQEVEELKATSETSEEELGRTKEGLGKANEELEKMKGELEGAREELVKSKAALECGVGRIREELSQVKLVVMEQNEQVAQRPQPGGHLQHMAPSPTPATPHTPWKIPAAASDSTATPAPCSPQAPELPNSTIHLYHPPQKVASSALLQHLGGFTLDSFLESAGLGDLAPLFGREGITLPMLPWLSDDMLRSLGVLKLGNRMKLHAALNCLLLNGGAFPPFISGDC